MRLCPGRFLESLRMKGKQNGVLLCRDEFTICCVVIIQAIMNVETHSVWLLMQTWVCHSHFTLFDKRSSCGHIDRQYPPDLC